MKSTEDYMEAIYVIRENQGNCRSIDIARHLGFSRPSVSTAIAKFEAEGLLTKSESGDIRLTRSGAAIARKTYEKHAFFRELLMAAGVKEETAEEDACIIEHAISNESYKKLKAYLCKKKSK